MKDFFTESEWDLIYSLVANNREFEDDDSIDEYTSILNKIHQVWSDVPVDKVAHTPLQTP
jgi:hypothetical protein